MNNAITVANSRLPMPANLGELDAGKWRVLCESVFPNAKTAESIVLALDYCKARKLDPFKRPVNIVPMWNKSLGREVETVWPGINEVQVTASRTGKYAGMDEPKWGPEKTKLFKGEVNAKGDGGKWEKQNFEFSLTYPEWCAVTVYRMIDGQRCPFTEPVYWEEAYARRGKTEIPNDMWSKRTRGQLLKVAKAFSLRAAFPEEGEYTAEEMEGKEIEAGGVIIDNEPVVAKPLFKNASLRNSWCKGIIETLERAEFKQDVYNILLEHQERCDEIIANGHEHDILAVESIKSNAQIIMKKLPNKPASEGSQADINALKGLPPEEEEWVTEDPIEELEPAVVRNNAATLQAGQEVPSFLRKHA